ncbi:MAG: ABC transporter permease subunit [Thermodesulfobacteriota bacterium]
MNIPRRYLLAMVLPVLLLELAPLFALVAVPAGGHNGALLSARQLQLLGRSALLSGSATLGALLLGVPLAFCLLRRSFPLLLCCLVPFFLPPYLQAMIWPRLFDQLLGETLAGAAIPPMAQAVWIFTLAYTPIVILLAIAGLRGLDGNLIAAARLARSSSATLFRVTLPAILPNLAAAAILVFVFCLVNFEVPDLLGFKVYPVEIFIACSAYYDEKGAMLLAAPMVGLTFLLIALLARIMRGKTYLAAGDGDLAADSRRLAPAHLLPLFYILAAVILPLAGIVQQASPTPAAMAGAIDTGGEALFFSLTTSLAAAALATLLALPLAYSGERGGEIGRRLIDTAALTPLALPPLILGLGLIRLFNRPWLDWLYNSTFFFVLALAVAHIPFAMKILAARLRAIPVCLEEAALLATGSRRRTATAILLPLLSPGIFTAMVTVFVLTLANLGIALLVLPPGRETLPLKLYNYLHYGALETVFRMSILLVLASAVTVALFILPARGRKQA